MAKNLISLRWEEEKTEYFPPLNPTIVDKILSREKDIEAKQKEIYDILIQSWEQSDEDKPAYYQRAHSKDPQYLRYLFNMYHDTDIQDLQELLIDLPHLLYEYGASNAYIQIEWENNYKKIAWREDMKLWLVKYITKSFIESIELKVIELWENNLFEIWFTLQQDGIKLCIYVVADYDWDVLEKTKEWWKDASAYRFSYWVNLDTSDKIAKFMRKLWWYRWDIKDIVRFD